MNATSYFSIYNLVCRSHRASVILHDVSRMNAMSRRIEKRILNDNSDGLLFVGFQYFSRFEKARPQYQKLSQHTNHICIFGYPDVDPSPIDNVTFVPLNQDDKLIDEWFLVYYGQEYYTTLVAQEVNRTSHDNPSRQYQGLWTFNHNTVKDTSMWLSTHVETNIQLGAK